MGPWNASAVVLAIGFESPAGWKLALFMFILSGVLLAATAFLGRWSRWLLIGGLLWMVATAVAAVGLLSGRVDPRAFAALSANVYGLSQFALLVLLVLLLAQLMGRF